MDPSDSSSLIPEHHWLSVGSSNQHHNIASSSAVLPESLSANCPLLSLPPELGLRIYDELFQIYKGKLCLGLVNGSWYRIESIQNHKPKTRLPGECVGLLTTCKQIFAEAQPVLCANIKLALYHCESGPMHVNIRSIDLTNMIPKVHKIDISIEFYAPHNLTSEKIRVVLAPFVEVTNSAFVARELKIDLGIFLLREQEYLDRVMLCFGDIKSNAKTFMFLDTSRLSEIGLNDASFTKLLKNLLR
jgi:hypothetical protein